jgi:anthranilate synthase component I
MGRGGVRHGPSFGGACGEVKRRLRRERGGAEEPVLLLTSQPPMHLHPCRAEFCERLEGPDPPQLLPVWTEVLCDGDTPLAAFARLREAGTHPFLLESVVGGERWARYSFVGVGHRARVVGRLRDDELSIEVEAGPGFDPPPSLRGGASGIPAIRSLLAGWRGPATEDLPRFWGGLVGVWGHDFVRSVERLPRPTGRAAAPVPAIELIATDTLVVFDNLTQRVKVIATACPATDGGGDAAYERAAGRIAEVTRALRGERALAGLELVHDVPFSTDPAAPWSRAGHLSAVREAKTLIAEGDIFQVVLSQGFDVPSSGVDLLDVYRLLRVTNPAPYMYMMELPSATLVGASPEVLVRVDPGSRDVTVRPIAGTRPRGGDEATDRALERELLADPKELAEHLMLIDLGRNDVGRVSVGGSVRVTERFTIERYSRVMHIVSEVTGRLRPQLDALDALAATFPAGTLSGAPKVRALEIIDALEPAERGWYGGAVGYLGYDGGADFAICIRSLVACDDNLRVQAGGGIVFDSEPEAEDTECRNKASAVLRAIAMARAGRGRA